MTDANSNACAKHSSDFGDSNTDEPQEVEDSDLSDLASDEFDNLNEMKIMTWPLTQILVKAWDDAIDAQCDPTSF